MSYIVKGVKIPVSCDSCPLMRWNDYGIDGELQYCNILHAICEHEEGQRDADCPLTELPPHGRLIDADKARKDEEIFWDLDTTHRRYEDTVGDIFDRQPTVLEAEGVKE